MKTIHKILIAVAALVVLSLAAWGVAALVRAKVGSISVPKKADVGSVAAGLEDPVAMRLRVPEGASIGIYATDIPGARVMAFDPKGRMVVSQTDEGKVTAVFDEDGDGIAESKTLLAEKLDDPHGLAFDCRAGGCRLYVAEHGALLRYDYDAEKPSLSNKAKLLDLESAPTDRHSTRSLLFLGAPNDDTLLISVGSSCNVCRESGEQRGKIMAYDVKTGEVSEYARGLRNAVFMALNPVTGEVYATEMGRDGLGDDTPPDEINLVKRGANYGWPVCYGKNIHDVEFDKNVNYIRNPCMAPLETPSLVDIQAHSAPLGLSFVPEEGWGEESRHDLLVAYHGSWNRSEPTGYKVVKMVMDAKGNYAKTEDFITGWLAADGTKLGRPADVLALPGGVVYVSDDQRGAIYRMVMQ